MADIPESTKMLPCPFCNLSTARVIEPANGTTPYVMCTNCTGAGPQLRRDQAIAAWNTRAAPPAMDREAVKEALFLLDRLEEFSREIMDDDTFSAFDGHVAPSVARLRMCLSTLSADAIRQGEGEIERLVADAFVTCTSGNGSYAVTLKYPTLAKAQAAHNMLSGIPATPASHASDGGKS